MYVTHVSAPFLILPKWVKYKYVTYILESFTCLGLSAAKSKFQTQIDQDRTRFTKPIIFTKVYIKLVVLICTSLLYAKFQPGYKEP